MFHFNSLQRPKPHVSKVNWDFISIHSNVQKWTECIQSSYQNVSCDWSVNVCFSKSTGRSYFVAIARRRYKTFSCISPLRFSILDSHAYFLCVFYPGCYGIWIASPLLSCAMDFDFCQILDRFRFWPFHGVCSPGHSSMSCPATASSVPLLGR